MSEQEFELYLKLLAKCLRLTSGQREEIADELRDHLEERLEELAKAGLPRDKAVVQALDEFGDAVVLAAHFTTIARLKRRRFLMRLSLGSVGVLTAGLLIAFAFWPENRAVRGPEQVVAQDKAKVEKPKTGPAARTDRHKEGGATESVALPKPKGVQFIPVDHPLSSDLARRTVVEARITEALDQAVDFAIQPQGLKEALDFIAARYQIPILTDTKALEDANVDVSTEVKLAAPGIALHDALQLLLGQLSQPLTYDVTHGVLMITTADKIKDHLETIVYDCRDLTKLPARAVTVTMDREQTDEASPATAAPSPVVQKQTAKRKKERAEMTSNQSRSKPPFIEMIISATGTEFWEEGTSISEMGGLVIVRQNPRVHDRIKSLLASIRLMKKDGAFASVEGQAWQARPPQSIEESGFVPKPLQFDPARKVEDTAPK
jgi:hypothetical protein